MATNETPNQIPDTTPREATPIRHPAPYPVFESYRQFRFVCVFDVDCDCDSTWPRRAAVARVLSDPFEPGVLWLAASHKEDARAGQLGEVASLHELARATLAATHEASMLGRLRVYLLDRHNAAGRVIEAIFSGCEAKPFDMNATSDGYAMEWLKLTGVQPRPARAPTADDLSALKATGWGPR